MAGHSHTTILRLSIHICAICVVCFGLYGQQNEIWKFMTTTMGNRSVYNSGPSSWSLVPSSSPLTAPSYDNPQANNINKNNSTGRETATNAIPSRSTPSSPRIFYSKLRQDQSGWTILDMLKAHSFAYLNSNKWAYGGACGVSVHAKDVKHIIQTIGLSHILKVYSTCPNSDSQSEAATMSETPVPADGMVVSGAFYEKGSKTRMQSTEWLNYIKQQLDYTPLSTPPSSSNNTNIRSTRTITVHIRRGDVNPCCYPDWYMPNKYFRSMIDHYIKKFLREKNDGVIQVNIYSQSKSFESFDMFYRNSTSVNVNVDVNVDLDGDIGNIWKSILTSDIIIPSRSEFSHVPSMFTRGHVVSPWATLEKKKGKDNDTKSIQAAGDDDETMILQQIHNASDIERTRIFNEQCTESMILQCKHKWWQKHRKSR